MNHLKPDLYIINALFMLGLFNTFISYNGY